jgi:phosphoribosylanthranilate isomerase
MYEVADGVVLDTFSPKSLGGTGTTFNWRDAAPRLAALVNGGRARVILAGGLKAENVGEAIATLGPDVVDVSSGIESAPGIKDPARMRAFMDAVRASDSR